MQTEKVNMDTAWCLRISIKLIFFFFFNGKKPHVCGGWICRMDQLSPFTDFLLLCVIITGDSSGSGEDVTQMLPWSSTASWSVGLIGAYTRRFTVSLDCYITVQKDWKFQLGFVFVLIFQTSDERGSDEWAVESSSGPGLQLGSVVWESDGLSGDDPKCRDELKTGSRFQSVYSFFFFVFFTIAMTIFSLF